MSERLIFHVDVNSAYLSWEAARRVKAGEADLRQIPSAVGGDPKKRTGIILAKSVPAKKFDVRTGEPVGMALRKCPSLVLVPPDFKLYTVCSNAFVAQCRRIAPVVEQYSIDECFLDMTGTQLLYPDPVAAAHELRRTIRDTLGFTVNVGIGPNKLLAKIAGDFEKPDRVHTLFREEIPQKLWPLPVSAMLGVGSATAQKLSRYYLNTVGDLARIERESLMAIVGKKAGEYLHRCALGIDESPVLAVPEEAKGYSVSTTLEENVTSFEAAHKIILALVDSVCMRMRADGKRAYGVAVTTRTADFQNRSHQCKLERATDVTDTVYATAKRLLSEHWDGRTPLRLLGVGLFDITDDDSEQLSLFEETDTARERALDKTVDAIRDRFGMKGIVRGGAMDAPTEVGKKYKAQLEADEEGVL